MILLETPDGDFQFPRPEGYFHKLIFNSDGTGIINKNYMIEYISADTWEFVSDEEVEFDFTYSATNEMIIITETDFDMTYTNLFLNNKIFSIDDGSGWNGFWEK